MRHDIRFFIVAGSVRRRRHWRWDVPLAAAAIAVAVYPGTGHAQGGANARDWSAVDRAIGRPGTAQPGEVQKYSFPRSDLHVTVGSVAVKPALALGSWVAFQGKGGTTMAMGDLVLTENEVAPVMSKLQQMGVELTALHNHLLHESPRVMYMHIHAAGDPVKIAQAVHAALALTKTPPAKPQGAEPAAALGLDTATVAKTLGQSGKVNGGVYQVNVARTETVREDGMDVSPAMGVATAINFQPTGGGKAAITGDFVMTAGEVNPVLKALRDAGIEVPRCTAICWPRSRGSSSLTSGRTTTRQSSRGGYDRLSTT